MVAGCLYSKDKKMNSLPGRPEPYLPEPSNDGMGAIFSVPAIIVGLLGVAGIGTAIYFLNKGEKPILSINFPPSVERFLSAMPYFAGGLGLAYISGYSQQGSKIRKAGIVGALLVSGVGATKILLPKALSKSLILSGKILVPEKYKDEADVTEAGIDYDYYEKDGKMWIRLIGYVHNKGNDPVEYLTRIAVLAIDPDTREVLQEKNWVTWKSKVDPGKFSYKRSLFMDIPPEKPVEFVARTVVYLQEDPETPIALSSNYETIPWEEMVNKLS